MRVTVLGEHDWAGSGNRIAQAVKAQSKGEVDIISLSQKEGNANKKWGIPIGHLIRDYGIRRAQKRLEISDIIHIKDDEPILYAKTPRHYQGTFAGLKIPKNKIVVRTVCGKIYRRITDITPPVVSLERYPLRVYREIMTMFTPELNYIKGTVLMPFAWNSFDYSFKRTDRFVISHIPSTTKNKGSGIIMEALDRISKENLADVVMLSGIPYKKSSAIKKTSSIYVDQFLLPVYGNAAVEAMAMGIPTMNWDRGLYPYDTPIIKSEERTADSIYETLVEWLDWDRLQNHSLKTFEYCKTIHGRMGCAWINFYKQLIKKP